MKVYLKKDVPRVGMAGEIIKVSDGFALNYILPKKLGVVIKAENEQFYKKQIKHVEHRKEVIATETSILAEKIKSLKLVLKKKIHDGQKMYGSVSPQEIVDLFAEKGIKIAKNQVVFDKSIKEAGTYPITIKLSKRLQPTFQLTVEALAD